MSALYPQGYAPWLESRFPRGVSETLATCDSCAMEKPSGITRDKGPFDPQLKCCTYFPFLPNFTVGALLKSGSAEARLRLQSASAQALLLPLGFIPTTERQLLSEERADEFGRSRELLCPFFDVRNSNCSIWKNRPAVCTSYHCKSDRGQEGLDFWADVETYLNGFERILSEEVFFRLGFDEEALEMCKAAMATEEPGEERDYFVAQAWKFWTGGRDEFFIRCAEVAAAVSADELDGALGDDMLELEAALRV